MAITANSLFERFDKQSVRERGMVFGCIIIVLLSLVNFLVLSPLKVQNERNHREAEKIRINLAELKVREATVLARKEHDPDRKNRRQLELLQEQTGEIQNLLESSIVNLVSPREMPSLLKDLLTQQSQLTLISLENIVPEQILFNQQEKTEEILPILFRHSLRLTFGGSYLTLLEYLEQLEQLPRTVVWEEVDIETGEYPETTVRLQVYTLSLLEGWIGG